jgi:DNA end-binding protein Ku
MVSYNKENLVLIRPAKGGLVLHGMFYGEEVRDFSAIPKAETQRLTPEEFELATGLIERLSSNAFDPEAYSDEYRERVQAMIDQKLEGQEITAAPRPKPRGQVVDIYEALKRSLATTKPRAKPESRKARASRTARR